MEIFNMALLYIVEKVLFHFKIYLNWFDIDAFNHIWKWEWKLFRWRKY